MTTGKKGRQHTHKEKLLHIAETFEKHDIPYFLSHGSLLGIVRDGVKIGDVDIVINVDGDSEERKKVLEILLKEGYILDRKIDNNTRFRLRSPYSMCLYFYKDHIEDLKMTKVEERLVPEGAIYMPSFFFDGEVEYVEYYDRTFPTFTPVRLYLEWLYGNWEVRRNGRFRKIVSLHAIHEKEAIKKIRQWRTKGKIRE